MTGLEAIKYLNDTCINFLDRTKELYCTVTFTRKRAEILRDDIAKVEKSLKALEIIKEKRVDCKSLVDCNCAEEYNDIWFDTGITEEEFNLLIEVLK